LGIVKAKCYILILTNDFFLTIDVGELTNGEVEISTPGYFNRIGEKSNGNRVSLIVSEVETNMEYVSTVFRSNTDILNYQERINNVELSDWIKEQIRIDNPKWLLKSNSYVITYNRNGRIEFSLTLKLQKGKLSKEVVFSI